jgi:hypothetical protein
MVSSLPFFETDNKELSMLQTRWISIIDPVLRRPQNQSLILKDVSLINGTNTIRTNLDQKLQGWKIVRQRAAASIYDAQDGNPNPATSLILVSNANVVVDIEVF